MKIYAISDLHLSINSNKPMNIFGPVWDNYLETIKSDWQKKVKKNDIVLIPGDISWAMKLEDAILDLKYISQIGVGTKIIIRGNHDYWWSAIGRVRSVLTDDMIALQNDSVKIGKYVFCGSRGWTVPEYNHKTENDEKIFNREVFRLELSLKNAMSKWDELYLKYYGNSDGTIRENALMWARIMMLDDKTYQEYLQSIGDSITLEKNECILVNYTDVKTKYFNGLYLTNYKPGDTITITDEDISFKDEEEILEEMDNMMGWTDIEMPQKIELNLKIKEVTNVIPKGANNSIYNQIVYLVVNEETFNDLWYKIFNNKNEGSLLYNIQTSDPAKMDETVAQLNQKYEGEFRINATNFEAEKQANENEVLIKSILLYSFFELISILSVINIFNIITSNIRLRRNEFAELKAIGMSQKQINRMLRLEGIFYGTTSIVLGLVISIIILYVLYINMLDTEIYGFTISVPLILITIILTYLVIFISIKFAKRKMKKENISEVIRENVD